MGGVGTVVVAASGIEPGGDGAVRMDNKVLSPTITIQIGEVDLFSSAAHCGSDDALRVPVDEGVFGVGDVVVGRVRVWEAPVEVGAYGAVFGEPEVLCAAVSI